MEDELEFLLRRKALELARRGLLKRPECPKGVVHVNRAEFEELLRRCDVLLADFWAEWCGPCRAVEPIVEEIAHKYAPMIAVVKVNVDENGDLAFEHGVMSIPTLILFHKGEEYRRFVGFYPGLMRELEEAIRSLI